MNQRIRPKSRSHAATRERGPESAGLSDAASGERIRSFGNRRQAPSSEPRRAAPGSLEPPTHAREAALWASSEAATRELAPPPEVLRQSSALATPERLAGNESNDGAPLRLFGGATPTARAVVAIAGFGTIAVLVLVLGLEKPPPTPDPSAPAIHTTIAAAAPAPPAPAAPEAKTDAKPPEARIRIVASAQPKAATWYLDDVEMGSNPLQTSAPRDMQSHTLRAEAKGFEPFVKTFRFDANIDVTVVLAPK
jgi:hypothetical protein